MGENDTEYALFYLDEVEERHVERLRRHILRAIRNGAAGLPEPEWVDDLVESCTRPGDEPIRTVGAVWRVRRPLGASHLVPTWLNERMRAEFKAILEDLAEWTRREDVRIGVELGGVVLGYIDRGQVAPR